MINSQKKLWIWGPIDGRMIYISYFMIGIATNLPRYYKYHWPEILFYFTKDKMTFISDEKNVRAAGRKHFNTWILNDLNFQKVQADYKKALNELKNFQARISEKSLSLLTDKAFADTYNKWHKLYINFWGVGLVPELSNLGGEEILKEELSKQIDNQKEFIATLEKLAAPENLSFYQKEELDLLEIKKYQPTKKFDQLIEKHIQQYFWVRNSYFEQKQLKAEYFKKILSGIKQIDQKIEEIKNLPEKIISQKKQLFKKYKLNAKTIKIVKRLSTTIWWQDARKKEIFIANHYVNLFLKEISRRKKINFSDLLFYWPNEIINLLKKGAKIYSKEIANRKRFTLIHYYKNVLILKSGKNQINLIRPFLKREINRESGTISGMVVSAGCGKIQGRVRILLTPRNLNKMKQGEILVAPMTSPEFIVAIKKAGAVITDEGGLTCHAAIVSRELGIPCLVGTKIATKVLKDGDLVEVNANHGLVRILKNAK